VRNFYRSFEKQQHSLLLQTISSLLHLNLQWGSKSVIARSFTKEHHIHCVSHKPKLNETRLWCPDASCPQLFIILTLQATQVIYHVHSNQRVPRRSATRTIRMIIALQNKTFRVLSCKSLEFKRNTTFPCISTNIKWIQVSRFSLRLSDPWNITLTYITISSIFYTLVSNTVTGLWLIHRINSFCYPIRGVFLARLYAKFHKVSHTFMHKIGVQNGKYYARPQRHYFTLFLRIRIQEKLASDFTFCWNSNHFW